MSENQQTSQTLKLGPTLNGQVLFFFAARHDNNPQDEQFILLRKFWSEFIEATEGRKKIVFIEGVPRETPSVFDEAVKQRGEVGAGQNLAQTAGVPIQCPEPDDTQQRQSLSEKFDPDEVVYTLIVQNLGAWFRRTNPSTTFQEAIERTLKREANFSKIYGFTPDNKWLLEQHAKLFGSQNLEDRQFLDSITDPRTTKLKINKIVAARTQIRNDYILNNIQDAWSEGKSIFIVYGRGHATVLIPQLQNFINKKP